MNCEKNADVDFYAAYLRVNIKTAALYLNILEGTSPSGYVSSWNNFFL